ncbi:hypothetical protein AAIH45_18420, partial [Pseudomonas aeruginosa]
ATMANQRIVPLERVEPMASPYFSLIVVPGWRWPLRPWRWTASASVAADSR